MYGQSLPWGLVWGIQGLRKPRKEPALRARFRKLLESFLDLGSVGFFCSPSPFNPEHRWQMLLTCLSEHRLPRLVQLQERYFCKKREAEKCKSNKHNK